ncbi:MAG TPA: caspase family protein, partial [Kofleriaceae bacterium]
MKTHALLIGIDHYLGHSSLRGCVNDVDAVQRVLLDQLGLVPDDITRLDSPRPDTTHDTRVPRRDATLAHIEAALAELASSSVAPGDRVFIYFSGHGHRELRERGDRRTRSEALVPMDLLAPDGSYQLLFDYQLNRRLAQIAARTSSVSIVLDCCFSAGLSRGDGQPRCLELPPGARYAHLRGAAGSEPLARGVADCHVVAACQAHETSCERSDAAGVFGVFTRAFTRALGEARRALGELTWAEIWQPMRATVEQLSSAQHAWMDGGAARAVFGGPPVDREPGLAVYREGDAFHVAAGSLAEVTPGTVLGVYGPSPAYLPWLDSEDDRAARLGELEVVTAELGHAIARPRGPAAKTFDLPADARARILAPGREAGLRYAIDPPDRAPPAMRDGLAGSPVLVGDPAAPVRL